MKVCQIILMMLIWKFFELICNSYVSFFSYQDDLWFSVKRKIPVLLSQGRVRLIIIDSIAALFRCEFSVKETVQRAKQLSSFAAHLKQLSNQYRTAIVCVNQVCMQLRNSCFMIIYNIYSVI